MKRTALVVLVLAGICLMAGIRAIFMPSVSVPPTPDIHALDCYSQYRQGQILDDRERWTVDESREQWQADKAQKRLEPGCWAVPPFKCGEDCR